MAQAMYVRGRYLYFYAFLVHNSMDANGKNLYNTVMPSLVREGGVHVNWCGIFYCQHDWAWNTSKTPFNDFDLWYVFGGVGELSTSDGLHELRAGDCFILRPRTLYIGRHDPRQPLHVIAVHYDYADRTRSALIPHLHRHMRHLVFFKDLLTRTVQSHHRKLTSEADEWLQACLLEISRQDSEPIEADEAQDRLSQLERLCTSILEDPSRPFQLRKMAKELHVSPDYFTRVFRKTKGMGPREFALRARVQAAQRLLLNSTHPVRRIAEILGFADIYHFSRQFKQRVGLSPQKFRIQSARTLHLIPSNEGADVARQVEADRDFHPVETD